MSQLDRRFAALADPTRRAILARLGQGETNVQGLRDIAPISQPALSHHLKILERAGLIETRIAAQSRPRRLKAEALKEMSGWLEDLQAVIETNYQRLDGLLGQIQDAATDPLASDNKE